ncbi:class I SAM-dependent methyltransferase [Pontibacter fetidus]|uniref:Class I SAM-dependent methyltransferase n=1 Tax=Pontibacter fetidus TaxID=2700082 RepID=A0A6B2H7A1_9BACT|nr:class I SAM-dependent methyltransferase [Pontibacter fetidus]NDK56317.1 class I SAM-dependent methyltransferase [Pontibacter fetidus]
MELKEEYINKPESYYSHKRVELYPFIPEGINRSVDIGCSNGSFSYNIKNVFNIEEVWGVEPNYFSANEAKSKLFKVINSGIEEAINELPKCYFDCVFFNDVLEHLIDPECILKKIKENITKDGFIFCSIPNILHFTTLYSVVINKDWKYENEGILDKTHLRFFTKKSIIRMFEECGYKVITINGINPHMNSKLRILNFLTANRYEEMKYLQFAILATPII